MKLALIQPLSVAKGRAALLQEVLVMLDDACQAVPAPDLIAFPGFAATGGNPPGRAWTPAMCDVSAEAFCTKAREWGVYVALGLTVVGDGRAISAASLIDPDGDVVAQSAADGERAVFAATVTATPIGAISVVNPDDLSAAADGEAGVSEADVLIMPVPCGLPVRRRRLLSELAGSGWVRTCGSDAAHVVLVCAGSPPREAVEADTLRSIVFGAGGELVSAPACDVRITRVELRFADHATG
jgi:predicted amidohydrolase